MSLAKAEYFLGGVSPDGFTTHFSELITQPGVFTYILKGGAGTGKSSLMKKVTAKFKDTDDVTVFYCASDPDSLDAVYLKNAGIIIVDGTSPHVFDPVYPGVCQKIINLGDFWDDTVLKENAQQIIAVIDENQRWHKRCRNYVSALSSLNSDTYNIAYESILELKLQAFISRLSRKLFPRTKSTEGRIRFAPISALTSKGFMTLNDTLNDYDDIYQLNDVYYAGADTFLREMTSVITSFGFDVIVSECTLFNKTTYQHILVPALKLAFISTDPMTCLDIDTKKIINFMRFYDRNFLKQKKQRLMFNKKASQELLIEAVESLKNAKTIHDRIEEYYIKNMNFDKINQITEKLIAEIENTK